MTKQYYHYCKDSRVEIFSMSKNFHYYKFQHGGKKSHANEQGSHCFHYRNYAQITKKQFHLLFVHDDNKLNSGQIGQVVAMGGSEKTQDFFLCYYVMLIFINYLPNLSMGTWNFQFASIFILLYFFNCVGRQGYFPHGNI